jgi:hypothetical protein
MPFTCKFQLNNGAIKNTDIVIFLEFIDSFFGTYQKGSVKIAKIIYNNEPAFLYSNSPAFLSSKGELKSGEILTDKTVIGYFSANGEDIPYDKPYAIIGSQ